jgi:hypothetical protein
VNQPPKKGRSRFVCEIEKVDHEVGVPPMANELRDANERDRCRAEAPADRRQDVREPAEDDPIARHLAESIAFGRYMVSAWADGIRVRVRNGVVLTVLGMASLPVLLIVIGLAAHMVLQSLAAGAAEAIGVPTWAGQLMVGTAALGLVIGGVGFAIHRMKARSHRKTVQDYEQAQKQQRDALGAVVDEQAAAR